MAINDNFETQHASELENFRSVILQKFDGACDAISDAQKKIDSFIDFCDEDPIRSKLLEKMTPAELQGALGIIVFHTRVLDMYIHLIYVELESFEIIMDLTAENINEMFIDSAEKVIELFITVQLEAEERLKDIEEINERFRNLARTDDS